MSKEIEIEASWKELLKDEFEKPYFKALIDFVKEEYKTHAVYPRGKDIFNAFAKCPVKACKVVILGQDPYHGPGQAHGLSFSVPDGVKFPPSLQNIFKEIEQDLGKPIPDTGNLERWAEQGVLLLNATLTVRANSAGSHQNRGWEQFTDAAIRALAAKRYNLVFMLWGSYAHRKGAFIDPGQHCVIRSVHPSPLAANRGGWFGKKQFSQANSYLLSKGKTAIEW